MARESVKILQGKLDVESLISQLNAALSEEWLAYYQYWVGALVVEGAMRCRRTRRVRRTCRRRTQTCATACRPHYRTGRSTRIGPEEMVRTGKM